MAGDPGPSAACLYVVATPIGNLEDITLRAIRVLREVDLIAAEDTRRARILLDHLGIRKPLVSFHDASEQWQAPKLVARLESGESIALISDAGTPLIADPGYRLVRAAAAAQIPVVSIPGASAPMTLLACAGLPTDRFTFIGFLPPKASKRRRVLLEMRDRVETIVLFETAPRLIASLADMTEILGARDAALGRELTKRFEEVVRGSLRELSERFAETARQSRLRGEFVIALAGAPQSHAEAFDPELAGESGLDPATLPSTAAESSPAIEAQLRLHLGAGMSPSEVAKKVAATTGLRRREVYARVLALRDKDAGTRGD